MTLTKEEFVGNGVHWNVKRVSITKNGITKSIIEKEFIKQNNIDKNITTYKFIVYSGLPTLSTFFKKKNDEVELIEAEDLNPKNCDGLYVSPNTVRNSQSCASIIVDFLNSNNQDKEIIDVECEEFNLSEFIKKPEMISDNLDRLREKRILVGAEKNVYENKIQIISNFQDFLFQSKKDMKKASDNQVVLFSDAFFFKVSNSNKAINYKIADFDCIISHKKDKMDVNKLFNGNKQYFETSLNEYIEFFVEESQRKYYRRIIKNVW